MPRLNEAAGVAGMATVASDSLRLALVYDCLYPQTIGGVEHRNAQLAAALAARGHRVTLAGLGETEPPRPEVEVLSLGPRLAANVRRGGADAARFGLAVARLPVERFDVVEAANIPFTHVLPLALRCRAARVPLLVTWHEVWGEYWRTFLGGAPAWRLGLAGEWLAAQVGDEVTAVSELTARRLAFLRRGGRVEVIPNGVPFALVSNASRRAEGGACGPPLVSAGRLLAHKRIDLLLVAVARLATEFRGPLLTLIGDGPERETLERQAARLGLMDRVHFTGKLASSHEVWRQLGEATIAVQPSAREGFGIFPLEAMAAGLPVVYCDSPNSAVRELVRDGHEGVATAENSGALASALRALLRDEPRRQALAAAARRRAADYDWGVVARRFEDLVLRLARRS